MRTLTLLVLIFAALLGASAHAQLPLPFEPEPDFSKRAPCSRDYVRSVEQQAAALAKLRTAGPEAIGRVCGLAEMGGAWLSGKLTDDQRRQLRSLLGFDVDLDRKTVIFEFQNLVGLSIDRDVRIARQIRRSFRDL